MKTMMMVVMAVCCLVGCGTEPNPDYVPPKVEIDGGGPSAQQKDGEVTSNTALPDTNMSSSRENKYTINEHHNLQDWVGFWHFLFLGKADLSKSLEDTPSTFTPQFKTDTTLNTPRPNPTMLMDI